MMRLGRGAVATAVVLAASTTSGAQLPSTDSLATLVPRAPFVFVALVDSPSVRAAPANPSDSRRVARLKVIDTIHAPSTLPMRIGERVRVLVSSTDIPPRGSRAVVFATGWLAGDRLWFLQVARVPVASRRDWAGLSVVVDSLRLAADRARFQQSVAASSLTAVGVVRSVVPIPDSRPPIARGEHDPVWARVTIDPISVVKGSVTPGSNISMLIPTNRTHMWRRIPRVVAGDTALFVLLGIPRVSPLVSIDSTASFTLADSVAVRRAADTVLVRPPRSP